MSEAFELVEDESSKLVLRRPGQDDASDVRLRRAFPWTMPRRFISIRSSDGKELQLIENLDDLKPDQQRLVERWLDQYSFIPKILIVKDVDVRFGYQQWTVETDRGPKQFRVQEREDIRFLHDGRFSIKDADGNVYELTSLHKLDDTSRRAVETLL
jgi:hypothetical protein